MKAKRFSVVTEAGIYRPRNNTLLSALSTVIEACEVMSYDSYHLLPEARSASPKLKRIKYTDGIEINTEFGLALFAYTVFERVDQKRKTRE